MSTRLPAELRIEDFEYDLPEELIAQEPPAVRHESRLMIVDRSKQEIGHRRFSDLPEVLKPGDVLVVNDTRVIPARLVGKRSTGGQVELLLVRPYPDRPGVWEAMATPLKKLKAGEVLSIELDGNDSGAIKIVDFCFSEDGQRRAVVDFGSQENVYKTLSRTGYAPLPPYIRRQRADGGNVRDKDLERYQTIFAAAPGAVAAPTAGLHFSEQVYERLVDRGVELYKITLHVGPGTFKPITATVEEHKIEQEQLAISAQVADSLNKARSEKRRIIAVGTTSCRALESSVEGGEIQPRQNASTDLYIKPGYEFKAIDGLVTNFHLSRSSLLVLVSAFGGHDLIMRAYREAVSQRYRFYSYGDAMLIL